MILFEWGEAKAESNRRSTELALSLLRRSLTILTRWPSRIVSRMGAAMADDRMVEGVVVLLVGHTLQEEGTDEIIRIITARKATRKERERYEENREKNDG